MTKTEKVVDFICIVVSPGKHPAGSRINYRVFPDRRTQEQIVEEKRTEESYEGQDIRTKADPNNPTKNELLSRRNPYRME